MRIVVTGVTSFIGAVTARQLLEQGHQVYGIVRPGSRNLPHLWEQVPEEKRDGLQVMALDMGEIGRLREMVPPSFQADAWLHVGWDGSGSANRTKRDVQQRNVRHSLVALETASALGCKRFVFTGSQAEYGICHDTVREDTPCHPVSQYGIAKVDFAREAESFSKERNMEYVHARIFSVYGPGDHPWSLVQTCLRSWRQGQEISLGECTQQWNFLYIEDAASALVHLLSEGAPGYYNVASRDTRPLRSYIEEMYALCGGQGSYTYGDRPPNAEGPADLMPDITKICGETGWRPATSFAEGIYETLLSMPE